MDLEQCGYLTSKRPGEVSCGDPINLVGLFRLHAGKNKMVPIVHTGHVATPADPTEPVPMIDRVTGKRIEAEVYLVEAQTLEGLSGSPAFIHEMTGLPFKMPGTDAQPKAYGPVRLLGLYSGAWDAKPGEIIAQDRSLRGDLRVPVGVGLVVPAEKMIELIREHPTLKAWRDKVVQDHLARNAAKQG